MDKKQQINDAVDQEHRAVAEEASGQQPDAGAEQLAERRRNLMDDVGTKLMASLDEAVRFRAQFEMEWVEDRLQFENGEVSTHGKATKQYSSSDEEHLSATDNITRPATITYAARLGDMLFPTSDRNWDLDTTPDPELPPEVLAEVMRGPDGNGLPEHMVDEAKGIVARKRMAIMRTQIEDQLAQSRYADEGRKAIMDACRIGHGVIKGPFARTRRRRRYVAGSGFQSRVVEEHTEPEVCRVDPWLVYPMPCSRIEDASGVFELHELSAKRVGDLAHQPGFSKEQVRRLLKLEPSWDSISTSLKIMRGDNAEVFTRNSTYAMFEYNGQMPREAISVFLSQLLEEGGISDDQAAEILGEVESSNAIHINCNVWMCQGIVVKLAMHPIDAENNLYKFFVFEERDGTPFGRGVPRLLRDPQASVRVLWAAIMLNAMMSSAPQIAVKKGALTPMGPNGQTVDMRCTRPRVWAFNDEVEDVAKAMQVFVVQSTLNSTMPVYERAKKNGEEQAMLPLIAQGEPNKAVPTSSGLAMLMNAGNVVQRRLAANWDAQVTSPVIEDFYDWNMSFGKPEAKGDYLCVPRASSHLLVKDIQAQHFLTALQLFSSNERFAARMKDEAWADEAMRIMDLDAGRFLYTQTEMDERAANQPAPPPDPDQIRAEAAAKTADARLLKEQTGAAREEGKMQLEVEDRRLDVEEGERERDSRERIAALKLQGLLAGLNKDEQLRVMEMAQQMDRDIRADNADLRKTSMQIAAQAQSDAMEISAEQRRPEGPILS